MRRFLHCMALLLAALILTCCPAALSEEAQEHLRITAYASPGSMVLAQNATLSFLLENLTDQPAVNVVLNDSDNGQHPVGDIAPGESATLSLTHFVSDEDLAAGSIRFSVSHSHAADDETVSLQEVSVTVSRELEQPEVEFTRQISNRYVHAGDELTLVYQVKNTGNVPLINLELSDPLGEYAGTLERLEIGETQTFISHVVLEQSAASTPTLRFSSAFSGQSYNKSLSSASVTLAEEAIFAQLNVDRQQVNYGESVTLTLTLTNGGNVSFTDITLSDSVLGMLENEPLSLASGSAPVTIARSCVIKSDTTFRVHVTGRTDAGTDFSVDTDPVSVSVIRTEGTADLTLSAAPSARTLSEPGMVSFTLTLTNNGQSDLSQVTLREVSRGEIRKFDIIPAGAPTVREQMYDVTENTSFQFAAEITDPDGDVRVVTSDVIDITIAEGGLTPLTTPSTGITGLMQGKMLRIGNVSVYPVMILGALLLLMLLIPLLVISNRRRIRQRNANRAERLKRSELLGRTNRFTPVSRRRKNK